MSWYTTGLYDSTVPQCNTVMYSVFMCVIVLGQFEFVTTILNYTNTSIPEHLCCNLIAPLLYTLYSPGLVSQH